MRVLTRTVLLLVVCCFIAATISCRRPESTKPAGANSDAAESNETEESAAVETVAGDEAKAESADEQPASDPPAEEPAADESEADQGVAETDQEESDQEEADTTDDSAAFGEEDAEEEEGEEEAAAEKAANLYDVPAGNDVEQLADFIRAVFSFRPTSQETYIEHCRKAPTAILAAANRILELENDKDSPAYQLAKQQVLSSKIQGIGNLTPDERQAFIDEVFVFLESKKFERGDLQFAYGLARGLEYSDATSEAAVVYEKLVKLMQESDDPALAEQAERMAGAARRLQLVGQEMKFAGTTVDGKPFELESLRGSKAILIDYWATWCGPCRAEYPNVRALYDAYHDQGFEVVGISGDDDRQALEDYIAEKEVPWANLFFEGEGSAPAMTDYGISAFPTMILIGPDFKVVSLHARGPKLEELLGEIFPDEPSDAVAGDTEDQPSEEAAEDE